MTDPVAAFLRYLAVEKNASPHTIRGYEHDLRDFERFLASREGTADPTAADMRTVRAWLASHHERGLDAATVARRLAALRSWFRFLVRRGVMPRNPGRDVRGPRLPRKLVGFLPIDEATTLVDARAFASRARERDVAVFELLYASGLRVSELTGLDVDDVDTIAR